MKTWIVGFAALAAIVVACTPQGVCERTLKDGGPNLFEYCAIATAPQQACTDAGQCANLSCEWQPGDRGKTCVSRCDRPGMDDLMCPAGYTCASNNENTGKFCFPDCHGRWVDATTWESNPIDSHWIPYPGERLIIFHLRDPKTGVELNDDAIYEIRAYIASSSGGFDGTLASGLLSEVSTWCSDSAGRRRACALNDTCADYFLRVIIHTIAPTIAPDAGVKDAATE
jgi:hypothetical protein